MEALLKFHLIENFNGAVQEEGKCIIHLVYNKDTKAISLIAAYPPNMQDNTPISIECAILPLVLKKALDNSILQPIIENLVVKDKEN